MRTRKVALASIAVVTVLCLVGVSILAVAAGGSSLAYAVNGSRTSQHDFDQQLDDIANSKGVNSSVSQAKYSVTSQVSSQIMTTNIIHDVLQQAVAQRGIEVSAADRAAGKQAAASQLGANASKVPASYRDLIVGTYTYANALGLTSNDKLNAFLTAALKRADVHVNPRYGHWSPRYGVCPPSGCAAASNTGG
jgi:hypothetical protein